MGTPDFAVPSLEILIRNGFTIQSVVTAPDKPRGRGLEVRPTPVKTTAVKYGVPVLQPENLKDPQFVSSLASLDPDLIVVVAFRILPREVFAIPRLGSFNLHASLLPRYRGAAPINWAIMNGETVTGVTTFFLEEKVDTGRVILQAMVPIGPDDDAGTMHDRLAQLGSDVVLETVKLIESGKAVGTPQDAALASPAPKIFTQDCRIQWVLSAERVRNFIRGLSPLPSAWTQYQGRILKILKVSKVERRSPGKPGEIVVTPASLLVSAADGVVSVEELQLEGRKRMRIEEFLRGYRLQTGDILE